MEQDINSLAAVVLRTSDGHYMIGDVPLSGTLSYSEVRAQFWVVAQL
jgi:hypothetical protein